MVIKTTHGDIDESRLARTFGFEDRPTHLVIWIRWTLNDELVRAESYPLPNERGPLVYTTRGELPYETLARTVELTDTSTEIAVVVCWRLDAELVRRDAHVILKHASVIADAVAASLG